MRVLVINGSPKVEKSNTMCLTRAFLDGAGWQDAEIVDVARSDIKACLGCFACWNKTPGKCVINDGMGEILAKLIGADVIIWSFPLYYFGVPGTLKNLIDRQLPLNLPFMVKDSESGAHPARYDLSHQRHIIISTCGFWTIEGNYNAVTEMFDHICGKDKYTKIFCAQGELLGIPELKGRTEEYLETVRCAGAEFTKAGISVETTARLAAPLFPQSVFEKMADASWGIDASGASNAPADDALNFTKQMAALYTPGGTEHVLELCYTDIDKTYQLLLTKKGSDVITDNFRAYTTRIETPYSVWRAIARGEISGQGALFQHQYRVIGDFSLMLKWDELFGGSVLKGQVKANPENKTNMAAFLLPWMVIWIAVAISPIIGGPLGIIAAALVPLLWLFYRPVIVEQISVPLVAGLSLAALLGADIRIIVPLSYLLFGLIWIVGAFTKIPLTANYSAAGYGGESAFSNPLFIQTNRILTFAWGMLYIITPIWTYFLMGTNIVLYTGLINSICPILMGTFTAWFQKWYPAWQAGR